MRYYCIALLIIALQAVCYAQNKGMNLSTPRTISGCITDAETGEPVIGASVFIANTTLGALTDLKGNYRFTIPGEGSYQLVVSHVGYQPVFKDIAPGNTSVEMNVSLLYKAMDAVVVEQKIKARRTDINLFWKTILGKPPSKKTLYPINPEEVFFFYHSKTRILKVTCRVPIQIINNELGYLITIILDSFTHDYNNGVSSWNYKYMFNELKPQDQKQNRVWEENRQKVYKVSLTNFIKSLHNNILYDNGFVLTYLDKKQFSGNTLEKLSASSQVSIEQPIILSQTPSDSLHFVEVKPETFVSIDPVSGEKTFFIPSDMKDFLMLICFGNSVNQNYIEKVDLALRGRFNWSRTGFVRSVLETPDVPVRIFPDGTFSNSLKITPCFSPSSLVGLNLRLPLDYEPDADFTNQ